MDADVDVVPPVEKIQHMCPSPPELDSDNLAETVEKKISKRDFYRAKKAQSQTASDFYKGSGLPCPEVAIPGVWFRRLPHPGGANLKVI